MPELRTKMFELLATRAASLWSCSAIPFSARALYPALVSLDHSKNADYWLNQATAAGILLSSVLTIPTGLATSESVTMYRPVGAV